jgi:serine/threonine-protein kinase
MGTVLLGKYRVDSILGRGGMGVVAEATHLQLGEKVAIKLLRQDVVGDAEACQRFLREAQAAVKLKSEHVARVTDVGQLPGGSPYMVMEFLEGVDLDQMITSSGSIAPPLAVEFVLQGCDALAEAHSLGIVHRDLKPSNFFVTWRPDGMPLVKVLDFGISKAPVGVDLSLTRTQSVLGTPAYMSPEQMRSARNVDARTDLWSLGTVLYELIEGHRPFEAESFSEMCVKVAADPPNPMTAAGRPDGLEAVIFRCLEKDPARRWQNIAELAEALIPFSREPAEARVGVERMKRVLKRPRTRNERPPEDVSSPSIVPGSYGGQDYTPPPTPPPEVISIAPRRHTTPYASGGAMPALAPQTQPQAQAPTVVSAPISITTAPDTLAETRQSAAHPSQGRRVGLIAGVAAAVVVIGVIIVIALSTGGGGTPNTEEPKVEPTPAVKAPEEPKPEPKPEPAVVAPTPQIDAGVVEPVAEPVEEPVVEKKKDKEKKKHHRKPDSGKGSGSGSAKTDDVFGKRI